MSITQLIVCYNDCVLFNLLFVPSFYECWSLDISGFILLYDMPPEVFTYYFKVWYFILRLR